MRKYAPSTAFEFGYNAGWDGLVEDLPGNAKDWHPRAYDDWYAGHRRGRSDRQSADSGSRGTCRGTEAGCYG